MFKKCTEKEIMGAIYGVAALKCNALVSESGIDYDDFGGSAVPTILKNDCFTILGAEGNAYAGKDAQTANSADGKKTYVVTKQKEGYTIDFPPYEVYSQKCSLVSEYFNKGIFIIQKDGAGVRVYGIAKGDKLYPFEISQINKIIPNGRFSSGTTLPTQQISFIINDDDVDLNIGYGYLSNLDENVLARIVKDSATSTKLTCKFVIGNNIGGDFAFEGNAEIDIPAGTAVALTDFEVSGITAVTLENGKLEFTGADDVSVEQVKPIAGIWTFGKVTDSLE